MTAPLRIVLFGHAPGLRSGVSARDLRIDVLRGLILLIIFINHMPGNVVAGWTPHAWGFSDAADAFVFLAGISAAYAYGRLIDERGLLVGSLKVAARIWTLYIAHIALFVLVCGVVATAVTRTQNPLYIEAINILPFFRDTPTALMQALTLTYQPYFLDILPLYIVLLAVFPVIYIATRFSPLLAVLVSAAIWQGAVHLGFNLPNLPSASGWFFNPFAWQFLFTLGVVTGRLAMLGWQAPRWLGLDLGAAAFLAFAAVVKLSWGNPFGLPILNDWIDTIQLGSDKTNLAWARVAHLVAMAWLIVRFLPMQAAFLSRAPARALGHLGRHSLEAFCVGVILSIAGQIVMAETSFSLPVQLILCLIGAMLLLGLGMFLSWFKAVTQKSSGVSRASSATAFPSSS